MEMRRAADANAAPWDSHPADSLLEHELTLCAGAIALVAGGGAPRIWLVGMRSGHDLIEQAVRMGQAADLLVRARWWPDEEAFDLLVRQHG
jgi:hypothetical protein